MKPRIVSLIIHAIGWAIFLLAIVVPGLGLFARVVWAWEPPADGFIFTGRQLLLLAKTLGLAGMAAGLSLAVSLPGAYVVGQIGRLDRKPCFAVMLALPLLLPPSVYVFGWQRILPPSFPTWIECVGIWALWASPIPALLIGTGWARLGRAAYESALLETSPFVAFHKAALPRLSRHVVLAVVIPLVLFLGDYGVPHACAIPVYSTELLGWVDASNRPIDTLWPSLSGAAVVLAGLLCALGMWRRCVSAESDPVAGDASRAASPSAVILAALVSGTAVVLPVAVLAVRMGSLRPMRVAFETYTGEVLGSLAVAAGGGLLALWAGVSAGLSRRFQRSALVGALAFGALPGGLVGEALVVTYLPIEAISNSLAGVLLGYVARFEWIAVLVVGASFRGVALESVMQARTDGADEARIALHVRAAATWPTLLFGACLIAALSLAEIPTSSMVKVPSLGLIAQILIEKFHKAEEGMITSLSLWLVLAVVPAALIGVLVLRRRGQTRTRSPIPR